MIPADLLLAFAVYVLVAYYAGLALAAYFVTGFWLFAAEDEETGSADPLIMVLWPLLFI